MDTNSRPESVRGDHSDFNDRIGQDDNYGLFHKPPSKTSSGPKITFGAKLTSFQRTRDEINLIEKERTMRINEKIDQLRTLLENSNYETKKDKFSILQGVIKYTENMMERLRQLELAAAKVRELKREGALNHDTKKAPGLGFEKYFLYASVPLFLIGIEGAILSYNALFLQLTGYSMETLGHMTLNDVIHPEDAQSTIATLRNLQAPPHKTPLCSIRSKCRFSTRYEDCNITMWTVQNVGGGVKVQIAMEPLESRLTIEPSSLQSFKQLLEQKRSTHNEHKRCDYGQSTVGGGAVMGTQYQYPQSQPQPYSHPHPPSTPHIAYPYTYPCTGPPAPIPVTAPVPFPVPYGGMVMGVGLGVGYRAVTAATTTHTPQTWGYPVGVCYPQSWTGIAPGAVGPPHCSGVSGPYMIHENFNHHASMNRTGGDETEDRCLKKLRPL